MVNSNLPIAAYIRKAEAQAAQSFQMQPLHLKGFNAKEIHAKLAAVHGENSPSWVLGIAYL